MTRHGDALENRYASYSAIEWLGPMKEATSFEVAFLVSATPPSGRHGGGVLRRYGYRQPERQGPVPGPSGSSSATPNSVWNFGI